MKFTTKKTIVALLPVVILAGIIYFLTFVFKNGVGPGLADYDHKIANTCDLGRSSAYVVTIRCEGLAEGVPPDVIQVGWNDSYLVAKTNPIPGYPQTYSNPDTSVTDWWIVDLKNNKRFGPFDSQEQYNDQINKLNTGNIEMMSVDQAKNKGQKVN